MPDADGAGVSLDSCCNAACGGGSLAGAWWFAGSSEIKQALALRSTKDGCYMPRMRAMASSA